MLQLRDKLWQAHNDQSNIYLHEDILNNKHNPTIVGKYSKHQDGSYSICGQIS